jgi:hypothetical protein
MSQLWPGCHSPASDPASQPNRHSGALTANDNAVWLIITIVG